MSDIALTVLRWFKRKWDEASGPLRVVYLLVLAGLLLGLGLIAQKIPGFDTLKELFSRATPDAQVALLVVFAVVVVIGGVWGVLERLEIGQLKEDVEARKNQAKTDANEIVRLGSLIDRMKKTQSTLLLDPCLGKASFVNAAERPTRFVTVFSLKDGVGKTTLTANFAACLSLAGKSVLLVDADRHGVLGTKTVAEGVARVLKQTDSLVHRLLGENAQPKLVSQLAGGMNGLSNAHVIIASEQLYETESELLVRFLTASGNLSADPRCLFAKHMHTAEVFAAFDWVIFDCPPLDTLSVVNAVACSDFVLIPTRLDGEAGRHVLRTARWLKGLPAVLRIPIIGVVCNQVNTTSGHMTAGSQNAYDNLKVDLTEVLDVNDPVFAEYVRNSPAAAGVNGSVAALTPAGRSIFQPFVDEFLRRAETSAGSSPARRKGN